MEYQASYLKRLTNYKKLKVLAVRKGTTVKQLLEEAIQDLILKYKKPHKSTEGFFGIKDGISTEKIEEIMGINKLADSLEKDNKRTKK